MHHGSGGIANRNSRPRGHNFKLEVGQKKRDGSHWKLQYIKNSNEEKVKVEARKKKPNGDHLSVDYTHDMKRN